MNKLQVINAVFACLLLVFLSGCAGHRAFKAGQEAVLQGNYDEAVLKYSQAAAKDPQRHEYRAKLAAARAMAAREHLKKARLLTGGQQYAEAVAEFRMALDLDPTLEIADRELEEVQEVIRAHQLVTEAEEFHRGRRVLQAKNNLDLALQLDPGNARGRELMEKLKQERRTVIDGFELDVASEKPITLKFKDADVRDVFNILSRLSGINFIFDDDVRARNVSVYLEDATFAQALQLLLNMQNLEKKVLNAKTIIIYPKTKEKEKQFEDQIIQTFYLSNIDAKKAVNLLRTMLQLRKVYVHEELNALVIREKPEVIKLARQIIEAADRADSEVVFDLELVEVNHGDDLRIGPELSRYAVSAGLAKRTTTGAGNIVADTLSPGTDTSNLVGSFSSLESFYTLPTATFNFAKTLTDSEILANPKIRVKNKDKAKVHIGTREPVITVTTTNETSTDNIQYIDVGVKLDVEPTIQLDNSIVTKLTLEVSSVSDRQTTANGSIALTITTTNAQSVLTLKDGEQTIIGGLIRDDLTNTRNTFPFLGEIPIIGDLLTSFTKNKQKREILLSITPHIVKSVDLPRADVASIWSGGEDNLKAGPTFGAFAAVFEPEADRMPAPAAPALIKPAPLEPLPVDETEAAPETPTVDEKPSQLPAMEEEGVESVELPPAEIPSASQPRVFLTGPSLVNAGETFSLDVVVDEVKNLYSVPLFVAYDPQRFEFVRAEEGDFLKADGQSTIFTSSANREQGQLIIGYKQGAGGRGASGAGTLFRLFFEAQAAGAGTVRLERLNFRDPAGNRLPVQPAGIAVEVR
jgi:general secretion pathway protein D